MHAAILRFFSSPYKLDHFRTMFINNFFISLNRNNKIAGLRQFGNDHFLSISYDIIVPCCYPQWTCNK